MNKESMFISSALEKDKLKQEKNTLIAILFCFAISYGLRSFYDILLLIHALLDYEVAYFFMYQVLLLIEVVTFMLLLAIHWRNFRKIKDEPVNSHESFAETTRTLSINTVTCSHTSESDFFLYNQRPSSVVAAKFKANSESRFDYDEFA